MGDQGLYVSCLGESESAFSLHTFNSFMRNALDFKAIADPIEYDIKGTKLGLFTQNFGRGPDPVFCNRIIKNVRIFIQYSRDSVLYSLKGFAQLDPNQKHYSVSYPPGDWEFAIMFEVGMADLPRFYGLCEEKEKVYKTAMEAL